MASPPYFQIVRRDAIIGRAEHDHFAVAPEVDHLANAPEARMTPQYHFLSDSS